MSPDFRPRRSRTSPPLTTSESGIKSDREKQIEYTPLSSPLREAICAWHKRKPARPTNPKTCVVSVGGSIPSSM